MDHDPRAWLAICSLNTMGLATIKAGGWEWVGRQHCTFRSKSLLTRDLTVIVRVNHSHWENNTCFGLCMSVKAYRACSWGFVWCLVTVSHSLVFYYYYYLIPFTEAAAHGRPPSLFSCLLISNENTDEIVSAMLCVMSSSNKRGETFKPSLNIILSVKWHLISLSLWLDLNPTLLSFITLLG